MKPDWKDAPAWANWLAMDSDGDWYWYESEPTWDHLDRQWYYRTGDKVLFACSTIDASSTREQRP